MLGSHQNWWKNIVLNMFMPTDLNIFVCDDPKKKTKKHWKPDITQDINILKH